MGTAEQATAAISKFNGHMLNGSIIQVAMWTKKEAKETGGEKGSFQNWCKKQTPRGAQTPRGGQIPRRGQTPRGKRIWRPAHEQQNALRHPAGPCEEVPQHALQHAKTNDEPQSRVAMDAIDGI